VARSPAGRQVASVADLRRAARAFSLAERYTRTEFIAEAQRNSPYPRNEFAYHVTGELKLAIEGYFNGRKTWSDGVRAKLEEKVGNVLTGLAGAAAAMRKLREEREQQSRRWEEQARIRAEQEALARRRARASWKTADPRLTFELNENARALTSASATKERGRLPGPALNQAKRSSGRWSFLQVLRHLRSSLLQLIPSNTHIETCGTPWNKLSSTSTTGCTRP
jgi:hypothetical protein